VSLSLHGSGALKKTAALFVVWRKPRRCPLEEDAGICAMHIKNMVSPLALKPVLISTAIPNELLPNKELLQAPISRANRSMLEFRGRRSCLRANRWCCLVRLSAQTLGGN
jgi:hypothetical protein